MVEAKRSELPLARRLGVGITTQRKALGWTQADLAEQVGVDTETISRFERGAAVPSLLRLEKISSCLRVGVGELLTETSAQPTDQAAMLSKWLTGLGEADRGFVVELVRQTCKHLRDRVD
jgi:transcriptional regulator with XRE-family HTH domain